MEAFLCFLRIRAKLRPFPDLDNRTLFRHLCSASPPRPKQPLRQLQHSFKINQNHHSINKQSNLWILQTILLLRCFQPIIQHNNSHLSLWMCNQQQQISQIQHLSTLELRKLPNLCRSSLCLLALKTNHHNQFRRYKRRKANHLWLLQQFLCRNRFKKFPTLSKAKLQQLLNR